MYTRFFIWTPIGVLGLLFVTLSVANAFPPNSSPWLSRPGTIDNTEALEYYTTTGAPATLSLWKSAYGFDGSNDIAAIYYNAGDLGFGREMHCRKNGADVACYVINHGLGPAGPVQSSIADAIANQHILPTVAMVYHDALNANPNDVTFYIYDPAGNRITGVALDSEGDKFVPNMCLACHGGLYNSTSNTTSGANFLPFDTQSFRYSPQPGYTLADQQEAFRQLNALVRYTNPTPSITETIDGWYAATGGVGTPGSTPDGNFVPVGYAGNITNTNLYNGVFKPNCRACHMARTGYYSFADPANLLGSAQSAVFQSFNMPHAELTSHNFWNSPAPALLAYSGDWSYRVTRLDDPPPDGCNPGDCSLREAIRAANVGPKSIITFDVDGVFALTRPGNDDSGSLGDLDITSEVILLGNGSEQTIIDGGGIDRVFHIHILGGTGAVIQNVTIQNGQVSNWGGGIYNEGGPLTLNNSVVKDNAATANSNTYISTDVPKAISDIGAPAVASTLTIAGGGGVIADVNVVNLNGSHTFINDLSFTLQSPAGTQVEIMAQSCGSEDDFNINLDDEAAPGAWPCPPNDGGIYQPSNPLSAFDGEDSTGTWTLIVADHADLDGGSLDSWGLEIAMVAGQGDGAGVASRNNAITEINYSTVGPDNVSSNQGGGLYNSGSAVITLTNSTVSGNNADIGGGLYNAGSANTTLNHTTFTGNEATSTGGGVSNINSATLIVRNTIVAGNAGGGSLDCDNSATYTSQGYNLVGQNGNAHGCPATDGTSLILAGAINTALDPTLSLAPGRTPYHALVIGGPAVDAIPLGGNCTLPSYDQLNLARPQDGDVNTTMACDIGAHEVLGVDIPISGLTASNNSPTALGNATIFTATIVTGTNVTYQWNFGDQSPLSNSQSPTHTYAALGVYTAIVTATNSLGSVSATTPATITNLAPVANAGADQNVNVSALVTLNGSASTDPDGHLPLTYGWTQTGGPAVTLSTATVVSPTFTAPATSAVLTFTLVVTDTTDLADATPDTVVVTVSDIAISGLSATNSSPTRLADPTFFTATKSAGTNLTYQWNFGDGTAMGSGVTATATHTYTAVGNYTAIVTATNSMSSVSASTPVTIEVSISGLSAANSSPTRLTALTFFTATTSAGTNVIYQWNFGDGQLGSGATATVTHTYAAAGNYTAIVTATNTVNTVTATTPVTITNLAPVADAGGDQNVNVSALVTLNGSASTDPDGHLPLTYGWTQTGGPAVTLSTATVVSPTFTAPATPAVLTFTLVVTDTTDLADATPDTVVVTVSDIAISGLSATNSSPTRLTALTFFTATISAGTNATYQWNFGDGMALGSGSTASHIYAAVGNYTAIVIATNSLGSVSASTPVTITQAGFKLYLPLITRNASPSALAPQGGGAPTTTGRPVPSRVARPVDPFPKV